MEIEEFMSNLSSENISYIMDSFDDPEEALDFYLRCAAQDVNGGAGIFNNVDEFFTGLRNLNSLEFI